MSTIAIALCAACAVRVGWILRAVEGRGDAVDTVPWLMLWGILALFASRSGRTTFYWVVICAIAVRLPLIGTPLLFSDDAYRYLWEGLAWSAGHNPFTEPPASIEGLDDTLQALVNHGGISSVYPPLAQVWFRISGAWGTVMALQLATAAVDVFNAALLWLILRGRSLPLWPALLYACHPLPAIESAASAHIEVVAISGALGAIVAWDRGHRNTARAAMWAGALVKGLPILFLPSALRPLGARAVVAWGALIGIGTALSFLPFWEPGIASGIGMYVAHWSFNPCIPAVITPVAGTMTKPILYALGASACLWAWTRHSDPLRAWALIGAAFVLLTPTMHPWYALWALVPSLALARWDWAAATIPILGSYLVLGTLDDSGNWAEQSWLGWVTWGPALTTLAAGYWFRDQAPKQVSS